MERASLLDIYGKSHLVNQGSFLLLLSENYFNISLADANAVISGLTVYLLSLHIFHEALENFIKYNCRAFDALIGNNSCYIVAYVIYILSRRLEKDDVFHTKCNDLILETKRLIDVVSIMIERFQSDLIPNKADSFLGFLFEYGLTIEFEFEFLYICMAFGCTVSKIKNDKEFEEISVDSLIDAYKNKLQVDLKKKSVTKLIKHWQRILSHMNVQTIQNHSSLVKNIDTKAWAKYLMEPYILEDGRGRLCTSSLYAQYIIYDLLLSSPNNLIGLQVNLIEEPSNYINRFTIYYEVQKDKTLRILPIESVPPDKPIYMFAGCRYGSGNSVDIENAKMNFQYRELRDLVFAHEVTYPQYPKSLNAKSIQPSEAAIIQEVARLKKIKGVSLEDPSDLCLVHIFVDNTSQQLLSSREPAVYLPNFIN